jgi:hypothetical protein
MANRFWKKLSATLGFKAEGESGRSEDQAAETPPSPGSSLASFEARASALIRDREALVAGKIHFLNLSSIKEAYGDGWPAVRERVATATESILRQFVKAPDFHTQLSDDIYVVMFDSADEVQARARCGLIGLEIQRKLFGNAEGLGQVTVASAVARIDGSVALPDENPMTAILAALSAAKDGQATPQGNTDADDPEFAWKAFKVAGQEPPAGPAPGGALDAADSVEQLLKKLESQIGQANLAVPLTQHIQYDPQAHSREHNAMAREAAEKAAIAPTDAMRIDNPIDAAMRSGPKTATTAPADGRFQYFPVWRSTKNAVTSYRLDIHCDIDGGTGDLVEISQWTDRPEILAAIDRLVVRKGIADLAAMLRQGTKALVVLPLHFASLDNPAKRRSLLSMIEAAPLDIRRLLILEICDSYAGDWAQVPGILTACRRSCRDVALRLSLDQIDMTRVQAAGVKLVGGDLREHPWTESAAMQKMNAFAGAAATANLETYIYCLHTTSLAVAAACAGFDYLSGRAIAEQVPMPVGVFPFSALSLYTQHQVERVKAAS